jgi:hypothetical protein
MKILLLVALAVSSGAGCAWNPTAPSERPPVATIDTISVEYEVYSALLAKWGVTGKSSIVLRGETGDAAGSDSFDETATYLKHMLMEEKPPISLSKDLLESYRERMSQNRSLDPARLGVADLRMVSSPEFSAYFGGPDDGWSAFRNQFGSQASIVTFSRVGFTTDGSRALLTLSRSCGALCGSSNFILLEKLEGSWRVIARVRTWTE